MPGNATKPTANRLLICGIRDASNAIRLALIQSFSCLNSDSKRSAAKLTVFMELAKIIPAIGITRVASNHVCICKTNCVTRPSRIRPGNPIDISRLK